MWSKRGSKFKYVIEIRVFNKYGNDYEAQAKYLVNGYKIDLWTNSIDDAIGFLKQSLEELEKDESVP